MRSYPRVDPEPVQHTRFSAVASSLAALAVLFGRQPLGPEGLLVIEDVCFHGLWLRLSLWGPKRTPMAIASLAVTFLLTNN